MNNGYCQLEINGEKIGLKFGLPAIRMFSEKLGQQPLLSGSSYNELGIAQIIYSGYKCNCFIKDTDAKLTFEDVYSFVEEKYNSGDVSELISTVKVFEDSRYVQEAIAIIDEGKKKAESGAGMTLNPSVTEN